VSGPEHLALATARKPRSATCADSRADSRSAYLREEVVTTTSQIRTRMR
jgi:hypothetical protein